MIFPQTDFEEWKSRFNLPIIEATCPKCNHNFKTTVPVLMQGHAGLSTPIHACGEAFVDIILTPMDSANKSFWSSVVSASDLAVLDHAKSKVNATILEFRRNKPK